MTAQHTHAPDETGVSPAPPIPRTAEAAVARVLAEATATVRAMLEVAAALYGSRQDVEAALLRLIETDRLTTGGARAIVACGDEISAALYTAAGVLLARRGESTGT